jgi:hypothetical protein
MVYLQAISINSKVQALAGTAFGLIWYFFFNRIIYCFFLFDFQCRINPRKNLADKVYLNRGHIRLFPLKTLWNK